MGRARRDREQALANLLAEQRLRGRDEGRRSGFLSVLLRVVRRLLSLDIRETAEKVEREGPERALSGLRNDAERAWAPRWAEGLSGTLEAIMEAALLKTDRGELPLSFDLRNPEAERFLDGYLAELSGNVTNTTRERVTDAIREGLENGESVPGVAGRIRALGEEFSGSRAELIARDQLLKATRAGSYIKAEQSGVVVGRKWRTARDSRVRDAHRLMEGQYAAMGEQYTNGQVVAGESDIQCRCTEEFVLNWEALGEKPA